MQSAVRPATEAEELIKKKERLVREKMQNQFGKIREEQRRLEEVQVSHRQASLGFRFR
jgi:hypothetical protein